VGLLRRKEKASHSVRMLAAGIYSSLNTTTILETTIVEAFEGPGPGCVRRVGECR
jgi:hypothetical protein